MDDSGRDVGRRAWLKGAFGAVGAGTLAAWPHRVEAGSGEPAPGLAGLTREEADARLEGRIRITNLETFLVSGRGQVVNVECCPLAGTPRSE